MDTVVVDVYSRMVRAHGCSADSILESPELRQEYLATMRQRVGDLPEQKLLHALTALRKRSKLPCFRDLVKPSVLDCSQRSPPRLPMFQARRPRPKASGGC